MISKKSSLELQGIAGRGGGLEIDACQYSSLELQGVAGKLQPGATMRLFNSDSKSSLELQGIAGRKPGQVIFA